ncbi:hypothetical protein B0H13DRAFT_2299890 [Mycena leptocephala]|nr:hypothetical protein B0H13DRAFT_2299890 [Mycena leptocephala]
MFAPTFNSFLIAAVLMADTPTAQLLPTGGTLQLCQGPNLGGPCQNFDFTTGQCTSVASTVYNDKVRSISTTVNLTSVASLGCTIFQVQGITVDIPLLVPLIPYNVPDNLKDAVTCFKCNITL